MDQPCVPLEPRSLSSRNRQFAEVEGSVPMDCLTVLLENGVLWKALKAPYQHC
jgi:hypothetical protein